MIINSVFIEKFLWQESIERDEWLDKWRARIIKIIYTLYMLASCKSCTQIDQEKKTDWPGRAWIAIFYRNMIIMVNILKVHRQEKFLCDDWKLKSRHKNRVRPILKIEDEWKTYLDSNRKSYTIASYVFHVESAGFALNDLPKHIMYVCVLFALSLSFYLHLHGFECFDHEINMFLSCTHLMRLKFVGKKWLWTPNHEENMCLTTQKKNASHVQSDLTKRKQTNTHATFRLVLFCGWAEK